MPVEDLPDGDDAEGVGNDCSDDTCETCNPSFFTIAEVVVGFGWFELVIENSVDGVPYEEVAQSAPKMGVKAFE